MTPVSMSCDSVHRMPSSMRGSDAALRTHSFSSQLIGAHSSSSSRSSSSSSSSTDDLRLDTSDITRCPSSHSMMSTRLVAGSLGMSPGTRTYPGGGSAFRLVPMGPYRPSNLRMLASSLTKSISSKMREANSSTASTARALSLAPCVTSRSLAAVRRMAASAATRAAMPGLCTLTATSMPSILPRYTCERDAAAIACPDASTGSASGHSSRTMALASSMGAGSISSWSLSSSAASSSPTRSALDASACPNLTYVGPSFSIVGTRSSYLLLLSSAPIVVIALITSAVRRASCPGCRQK